MSHIAAGLASNCAIATSGRAWCWGNNFFGNLGDGTVEDSPFPVTVSSKSVWREIRAGPNASHFCGITVAGRTFCWGWNLRGQLGDGTTEDRASPTAVVAPGS